MNLVESSLIKKYENDIGDSIVKVGGVINHDNHYLPFLDDQILNQLLADEGILKKVKELIAIETNERIDADEVLQQEIDKKYTKPSTGIPASDIADGVIPDVSQFITRTVNDLTNYYLKSETYTKDEVAALIGSIRQFHYEVYVSLPETGESNVLYLIGPTGTGSDLYEEYVYSNGWVKIGDTSIDLSGYAKSVDIPVEKGSGENSVQQKGTGAVASGESSVSTGVDSFAGQKGYKYTNTGSVTNQLTLTSVDGLSVGDIVSIVNDSKYPDCATITEINDNTITLDSLPFDSIVPDLTGFDDYVVYVSAKPNIGDVDLAIAAHAEGIGTKAQNYTAHAEGKDTKALGEYSHAEGRGTVAQYAAHAEGKNTKAEGEESHSEGMNTKALGNHSHAEGDITEATNYNAHAEGYFTKATGNSSHAEGGKWVKGATGAARVNGGTANGDGSHAEGGKTTSEGDFSHAEGYLTIANANNSHAEGQNSRTGGETRPSIGGTTGAQNSHAEGSGTWAIGLGAHSEGGHTVASGNYSHAEGYETQAGGLGKLGPNSHTEGFKTATGDTTLFDATAANTNATPGAHAHAEGNVTVAVGRGSHSEGEKTKAQGIASHAEGGNTTARGDHSHAEGDSTTARGASSHSEGINTTASRTGAHAEGYGTTASGYCSHAEGYGTTASGESSHAEGYYTETKNEGEHAEGSYNKSNLASYIYGNAGNTQHSVGIGTSDATRKNAFEIMQNGDAYLYLLGGYDGTNPGAAGVKTIKQEIDEKYTKPATGIPASDMATGVIPDVSQFITRTVNDLTNYYLKTETYTKSEVESLIGAIQQFHYEVYTALPATGESNVLYLIGPTGTGSDRYEEYVYASESFVKIGDTSIDLSGYVTTQALNTALADYTATANLSAVALSGSYNDLLNKPTIPEDRVFWAEEGVTTAAEILAASESGKIVMCSLNESNTTKYPTLILSQISSTSLFFTGVIGGYEVYVCVVSRTNDSWSRFGIYSLERDGNKVSSWQATPDNTHYPSEKLVYDSIAELTQSEFNTIWDNVGN